MAARGARWLCVVLALAACGPQGVDVRIILELSCPASTHAEVQARVRGWLEERGARDVVVLPLIDLVSAVVPRELVAEIRTWPSVVRVTEDAALHVELPTPGAVGAPPRWNLDAIGAPALWRLGLRGAGAVVANLDTGVDGQHPELRDGWRGGPGDWFDPWSDSVTPFDPHGHGTATLGLIAGRDTGVAPGARWIAARVYDEQGQSTISVMHRAFEWALDPDGDPSTDDAPDVVNASWGLDQVDRCDLTFAKDLAALRNAGIVVVLAAGNSGPSGPSSVSPANNPGAFSVGASTSDGAAADFTSRGPSTCTGEVFPSVVAPGQDVRTTDVSLGIAAAEVVVSGTSFAAPHVAGAAALLRGADPTLTVPELEAALTRTAGDLAPAGPDEATGHGLIDVERAWRFARPAPLGIVTHALPAATEGCRYGATLQAEGGFGAYRWTVASGALPEGLRVDGARLVGTPVEAGVTRFALEVRDERGDAARHELSLSVRVDPRRTADDRGCAGP